VSVCWVFRAAWWSIVECMALWVSTIIGPGGGVVWVVEVGRKWFAAGRKSSSLRLERHCSILIGFWRVLVSSSWMKQRTVQQQSVFWNRSRPNQIIYRKICHWNRLFGSQEPNGGPLDTRSIFESSRKERVNGSSTHLCEFFGLDVLLFTMYR